MNTPQTDGARGYKLSFIINGVVGGMMLLLGIAALMLEILFPFLGGSLAWGFLIAAAVCLSVALVHWRKYLRLTR